MNCLQCTKLFTGHKRKFCEARCRWEAAERRRGTKPMAKRQIANCQNCQKSYLPKEKNRSTYCSRDCAFQYRMERRANNPFTPVCFKPCRVCNRPFNAMPSTRAACSDVCEKKFAALVAQQSGRARHNSTSLEVKCKACELFFSPLYGHSLASFCSVCAIEQATLNKRIAKMVRRARKYGAMYEPVNPINVFARDRWTCRLCGLKTPVELRGRPLPNAPELDHIIPLSKGGEHSYRNTQCACRACNISKGSEIRGQLLLLG